MTRGIPKSGKVGGGIRRVKDGNGFDRSIQVGSYLKPNSMKGEKNKSSSRSKRR
jgi:hypothetical protein